MDCWPDRRRNVAYRLLILCKGAYGAPPHIGRHRSHNSDITRAVKVRWRRLVEYAAWKLFIDAAEFGSLSKVALAYGTSQPHISRRISELEQQCGGRLLQRT